ncbi:MAG: hypothetical protein V3T31_05310, partial [candidate division Zixibacteria bacterium]
MHRFLYFTIFLSVIIGLLGLINVALLRFLTSRWWRKPLLRGLIWFLPVTGIVFVGLWALFENYQVSALAMSAAALASLVFVVELCLCLTLPLSGMMFLAESLYRRYRKNQKAVLDPDLIDPTRRELLSKTAIGIPAIAIGLGSGGMISSFNSIVVELRPLEISNLPNDLEGLRILHLSDLHLHHYVTLTEL